MENSDEEQTMDENDAGQDSGIERRGAQRLGIEATARIHGEASWSGAYSTSNLSRSGAFLISDDPPPRGEVVSLDLELGSERSISDMKALVVHISMEASEASARGCGIMFLRLSGDHARNLDGVLVEMAEGADEPVATVDRLGDLADDWTVTSGEEPEPEFESEPDAAPEAEAEPEPDSKLELDLDSELDPDLELEPGKKL